MSKTAVLKTDDPFSQHDSITANDFLTLKLAGQTFGIPVLQVQDVLGEQTVNCIPLSPPEVAGSLNLRGRIVTAIDVRRSLGLPPRTETDSHAMSVVVEHEDELYSLIIDAVGDVLSLKEDSFESNPATLDSLWHSVSLGVYRLEKDLLLVLDIARLLQTVHT